MFSLETFHWRLDLWLDPDEHLMAFYYSVDGSPAAGQVILVLDSPRSPRRMFLFELDYPLFEIFWNGARSNDWSWFLWFEIVNASLPD